MKRQAIIALGLLVVACSADAQQYPSKPIRFIVPFAAGGGNDLIGRAIAQKLNEAWGVPVIVEKRYDFTGEALVRLDKKIQSVKLVTPAIKP